MPFKFSFSLLLSIGLLSGLISCGGGGSSTTKSESDIQVVSAGDLGDDIKGFQKVDSMGNSITTYLPDNFNVGDISIQDGIDYGKPEKYEIITNNFIEIIYPSSLSGRQVVHVQQSSEFNTVMLHNPDENTMEMTPYLINDQGSVEFRAEPINNKLTFSLINIEE